MVEGVLKIGFEGEFSEVDEVIATVPLLYMYDEVVAAIALLPSLATAIEE